MLILVFVIVSVFSQNVYRDLCPLCSETLKDTVGVLTEVVEVVPSMVEPCALLCSVVGLQAFVTLIKKADLDPIYICQEMKVCPIQDCTLDICGKFTHYIISPRTVDVSEPNAKVHFELEFDIYNKTGTSELRFRIDYPEASTESFAVYDKIFHDGFEVKHYDYKWILELPGRTELDNGSANVTITLCEGWCGSRHDHTRTFDGISDSFEITGADY